MANGWTKERRARQSALIRTWKPWEQSAGPQTEAGKMRSSQNALIHGGRSKLTIRDQKRINELLRDCQAAISELKNE